MDDVAPWGDLHRPMTVTDSCARVDQLTTLGIPAVAARGWAALTPSVIAEAAGCTRQAVHQWFGPGTAMRHGFAGRFTARWSRWAEVRVHFYGPEGLLPTTPAALAWVRVAWALREQAVRDPELARLVQTYRVTEAEALAGHLRTGPAETATLQALLDGLRLDLLLHPGVEPGSLAAARASLRTVLPHVLDVKQTGRGPPPAPATPTGAGRR